MIVHGCPVYVRHDRPPVEAIAVDGGHVVGAGSLEQMRSASPADTPELTLTAGAVLPAFVDPHQHAFLIAADPSVDLLHGRVKDLSGLLTLLRDLVAAAGPAGRDEPGSWLRFHGYLPLELAERRSPTAAELDTIVADRPLHIIARTYHESAVNSAGLEALGISRNTPDPPGGRIARDRRGRPNGVLIESASFQAEVASRPRLDADEFAERLAGFARVLLRHGITRIGDAAVPSSGAAGFVTAMAAAGVDAHPMLIGERIDRPAIEPGSTAKLLADGGEYSHLCLTPRQLRAVVLAAMRASWGAEGRTARAVANRSGRPRRRPDGRWETGISLHDPAELIAAFRDAADLGAQLAVHAVGNGAVDALLGARKAAGTLEAVPLRIEHAMALDDELADRLAEASVSVVVQPVFLPAHGHELSLVPLPDPLRMVPVRSLVDRGVPVSISSDFPAAALDPWQGVAAAVLRCDRTGRVLGADEALEVGQALVAATSTAGELLRMPGAGTLEMGARADFIWCDRNPHTADPEGLADTVTWGTWRAGTLMHRDDIAPWPE